MATYLEIVFRDSDERVGKLSLPVADVALPAGYQAKIDAVVSAMVSVAAANPILAVPENLYQTRVVIDQAIVNANPPAYSDIRPVWELLFQPTDPANGTKIMRAGLPVRTDEPTAYDAGSKGYLINQSNAAYQALVTALGATGVDVKINYPTFASASLVGARAITSKRRTTAISGGTVPGQATAISHLELLTRDANNRKAVTSIPVAAVALPAGYAAKITAVLDALTDQAGGGTALLRQIQSIWYTRVVIYQTALFADLPLNGDKSIAWRFQCLPEAGSGYTKPFSFSIPCRDDFFDMTTVASKGKLIDTSNQNFIDLQTALSATGVAMRVPYQTDTLGVLDTAFALGTSRKAPNL